MLSAYRNADGTQVFVAINYSEQEEEIALEGIPKEAELHAYRTSDAEGENLKPTGHVKASKIELPAKSITTIINQQR